MQNLSFLSKLFHPIGSTTLIFGPVCLCGLLLCLSFQPRCHSMSFRNSWQNTQFQCPIYSYLTYPLWGLNTKWASPLVWGQFIHLHIDLALTVFCHQHFFYTGLLFFLHSKVSRSLTSSPPSLLRSRQLPPCLYLLLPSQAVESSWFC